MKNELETLNWIRKLMKPLPATSKYEDRWICGKYRSKEQFVLINLRVKVLKAIERLEKELEK
jgi:hypothetical protein